MKSKNQSSERSQRTSQSYDSKLKSSLTLSFKFWLYVFRLSFLAFCLSASAAAQTSSEQLDPVNFLTAHLAKPSSWRIGVNMPNAPGDSNALSGVWDTTTQAAEPPSAEQEQSQTTPASIKIAPANSSAGVDKKSPQESSTIAGNSNSQARRQLQQARITAPKNEKDRGKKNELQQIIKQIQSVEFKPQKDVSEPIIAVGPTSTTESNETLSDTEASEEPWDKEKEIESKPRTPPPYESVTDQTLQMLKNLSQHPDQVDKPFELGEVLFLSGHLKEAGMFYQEALNRKDAYDIGSAQDRAWILFQIGNCLRDRDRPMARETYRQLITEYPESPWADLAKAQDRLINWYQKDKPWRLIGKPLN